jgi:PPOX class probable FMN-dependent enzyme
MSPLLFLSTSNADGKCDVSPRGDQPGFVHVVDEKHLLIPDKPGNRRIDSMLNILSNPHVGLILLIPGLDWVLRMNGSACIVRTSDLVNGNEEKLTELSIAVEVEECFIHCPRALNKSNVWKSDEWPSINDVPSPDQMFRAHLEINGMKLEE